MPIQIMKKDTVLLAHCHISFDNKVNKAKLQLRAKGITSIKSFCHYND